MRQRVRLKLRAINKDMAQILYSTLKPDNKDFPNGLKMRMCVREQDLILDFTSNDGTETLISTIDDVLESIQISLETLKRNVSKECWI